MSPKQLQRLLHLLPDVRSTDDLLDLEHRLGPFDEENALDAHALFLITSVRCRLAGGPAPSADRFTLVRAAPASAQALLEMRGRMGNRIVRVAWVDGALYGSLHALRRLEGSSFADAESARTALRGLFDEVIEEIRPRAVA